MNDKKNIELNIDETSYSTYSTPAYQKTLDWKPNNYREVTAIIPGTIIEIKVKVGDVVSEGDEMLVIEAMKMNNQLKFPTKGTVDKIVVSNGDIVAKGKVLIILK